MILCCHLVAIVGIMTFILIVFVFQPGEILAEIFHLAWHIFHELSL